MRKKAFTLLELLIVIIIIGVLALLFLPRFRPSKESVLNQEARSSLKLIQSAEKIYRMEKGNYTPAANEDVINDFLKLALSNATNRPWDYSITTQDANQNFTATAVRIHNEVALTDSWQRTMSINATDDEPTCTGSFCK